MDEKTWRLVIRSSVDYWRSRVSWDTHSFGTYWECVEEGKKLSPEQVWKLQPRYEQIPKSL